MADGLSWYFQLVDRVTGPAKDVTKSLSSVSDSFKSVEKAAGGSGNPLVKAGAAIRQVFGAGAEGAFYKGAAGIAGMLDKIDKIIPLDALKAVGGVVTAAGAEVLSVVTKLVEVAAVVAVAAAGLVAAGFKFAAESADAKRTMLVGLQAQLGDSTDARAFLDTIEGFAKKTALEKDQFTGYAKQLLGAGFAQTDLKPLLGALSDIQALNGGDAGKADQLMAELSKIRNTDKVGTRDLAGLASLGISNDKVFQALADQKNLTLQQVKGLFESGSIKSDEAINAILKSVQTNISGGRLGGLGLKLEEGSIDAQLKHLHDAFGDLFENVDIKPITDFLGKLNAAISGPVGDKIAATINKAFAAISKLFDVKGDDLESTLDKVADGFDAVVTWAIKFGEETKQAWDKVEPGLTRIVELTDRLSAGPGGASTAWQQLGLAFEVFVSTIEAQFWVFEKLGDLSDQMVQIGADIVTGLWDGLRSGWDTLLANFHELVDQLPASVRKILGIQSPSKVFADLGMQTGAGFSVGLDASDLPGIMEDALTPPRSPAFSGITAGTYASRQGGGGTTIELHINVSSGAAEDEEGARRIAEAVRIVALPELMNAMEQLQIETGG